MSPWLLLVPYFVGWAVWATVCGAVVEDDEDMTDWVFLGVLWPIAVPAALCVLALCAPVALGRWIHERWFA